MSRKIRNTTALLLLTVMLLTVATGALAEDGSLVSVILTAGTTQAFTTDAVSEADLTTILQAGLQATSAINQQPWYFVALTNRELMAEIGQSGGMPAGGFPSGAVKPNEGGEVPAAPAADAAAGATAEGAPAPDGDAAFPAPDGDAAFPAPDGDAAFPAPDGDAAFPAFSASSGAKAALGDSPLAILIYKDGATKSPNADFDCGLACQNMVIAANALGYGTKIISSPSNALNGEQHDALCEKLGVDPAMTAVAVLLIGRTDSAADGASGASVRNDISTKVSFVD